MTTPEKDDWITLFYLMDYTYKKKNVILAIGFKSIAPAEKLIGWIMFKLNRFFKDGYSVDNVELISYSEFEKRYPDHKKHRKENCE